MEAPVLCICRCCMILQCLDVFAMFWRCTQHDAFGATLYALILLNFCIGQHEKDSKDAYAKKRAEIRARAPPQLDLKPETYLQLSYSALSTCRA